MVLSDLNLEVRKVVISSLQYQVLVGKFGKCIGSINANFHLSDHVSMEIETKARQRIMMTSFELCFNAINFQFEFESHYFYNLMIFSCKHILRVHYLVNCDKLSIGARVQHFS